MEGGKIDQTVVMVASPTMCDASMAMWQGGWIGATFSKEEILIFISEICYK